MVLVHDGSSWTDIAPEDLGGASIRAAWTDGTVSCLALGPGPFPRGGADGWLRENGGSTDPSENAMKALYGSDEASLVGVGDGGAILRRGGVE